MVKLRCCGAASPGSSPQRWWESQLLLFMLPIGAILYQIRSLCVQLSRSYCSRLTAIIKDNIENKTLRSVF